MNEWLGRVFVMYEDVNIVETKKSILSFLRDSE